MKHKLGYQHQLSTTTTGGLTTSLRAFSKCSDLTLTHVNSYHDRAKHRPKLGLNTTLQPGTVLPGQKCWAMQQTLTQTAWSRGGNKIETSTATLLGPPQVVDCL